ncbi:hypothetical protein GGI19_002525 [Coemansia pectinata]|uniref:Nuclear speckle splicing regulatory protein 1 N-terminal domain-containing protein n=1 Tax=Coemansia pectinata TaxID=1052879 RepID=A0A9W8LCE3_9FUNG|nr:hypothetical protein GGI19_002525 [Coemansia pectinata]
MRKTATLKFGLNVPKQGTSTAASKHKDVPKDGEATRSKKSVFAEPEALSSLDDSRLAKPNFTGGSQTRASEKLASELQATDPSVYAYDEVYDEISNARDRSKQARKQADDLKPRYMEKILETAKQRQVQHEVVREKMLDKEREREGDMFADKETFVTNAYKEQKEQRQKLVEDEDMREAAETSTNRRGNGVAVAAGFYRGFLDQIDRDDINKAVVSGAGVSPLPQTVDGNTASHASARKSEVLVAGLNIADNSARPRHTRVSAQDSAANYDYSKEGTTRHRAEEFRHNASSSRSAYSHIIEQGLNAQQQMKDEARMREHEALVKKYARRNDAVSIEAARQRYLARKQQYV